MDNERAWGFRIHTGVDCGDKKKEKKKGEIEREKERRKERNNESEERGGARE